MCVCNATRRVLEYVYIYITVSKINYIWISNDAQKEWELRRIRERAANSQKERKSP